jgi:hypothetical protein
MIKKSNVIITIILMTITMYLLGVFTFNNYGSWIVLFFVVLGLIGSTFNYCKKKSS